MTGKTHVVGGNVFALGSYILMKKTGLLVDSVWEPLQLGIILPYATWASTRSEERRVGKECRSRWSPYH